MKSLSFATLQCKRKDIWCSTHVSPHVEKPYEPVLSSTLFKVELFILKHIFLVYYKLSSSSDNNFAVFDDWGFWFPHQVIFVRLFHSFERVLLRSFKGCFTHPVFRHPFSVSRVPKRKVRFYMIFRNSDSPTDPKHAIQFQHFSFRRRRGGLHLNLALSICSSGHFIHSIEVPPWASGFRNTFLFSTKCCEAVGSFVSSIFFLFFERGLLIKIVLLRNRFATNELKFYRICTRFILRFLVPESHMHGSNSPQFPRVCLFCHLELSGGSEL